MAWGGDLLSESGKEEYGVAGGGSRPLCQPSATQIQCWPEAADSQLLPYPPLARLRKAGPSDSTTTVSVFVCVSLGVVEIRVCTFPCDVLYFLAGVLETLSSDLFHMNLFWPKWSFNQKWNASSELCLTGCTALTSNTASGDWWTASPSSRLSWRPILSPFDWMYYDVSF